MSSKLKQSHVAGREMDKKIAKCEGLNLFRDGYSYYGKDFNNVAMQFAIPHYSTDIQEAIKLVEKYDFYIFEKTFDYQSEVQYIAHIDKAEIDGTYSRFSARGISPSETLGRAYLNANEENKYND